MTTLRKLRETFANTLTKQLDDGYVIWHDDRLPPFMPRSLSSAKNFNGINAIILMLAEIDNGYDDPRWVSYRKSLYLKKGEKGVALEWWDKKEPGEIEFRSVLCFNVRQLFHYPVAGERDFEPNTAAARRVLNYFNIPFPLPVLEATSSIDEIGNAYFRELDIDRNEIFIFKRKDWRVLLKTALDQLMTIESIPGNPRISIRQKHLSLLRTDLAASFLTLSLGMGTSGDDNSLPLKAWAAAIRENPSEIARAAVDAQKLVNKLLTVGNSEPKWPR
jgi:hypothetical protein